MKSELALSYRPNTYFRPQKLERDLLSNVKGGIVRSTLQTMLTEGRHAEVNELLRSEFLSAEGREALESFHPMYMGGNYLAETEQAEVEIGRIRIASTTCDVTCVYARADERFIHYRVVDEYGGETLQGAAETRTNQPMTLGDFAEFFCVHGR
jgi:hypothetical protein